MALLRDAARKLRAESTRPPPSQDVAPFCTARHRRVYGSGRVDDDRIVSVNLRRGFE
jgi:hypothetical protein